MDNREEEEVVARRVEVAVFADAYEEEDVEDSSSSFSEAEEEELEEEARLAFGPEEPLPDLMSQEDPLRMKLTREERDWALDIKDVIEGMMPDIDNLPDFWYAQLAIICKDDIEDACHKAKALQDFREEYGIRMVVGGGDNDDGDWDSLLQEGSRRLSQLLQVLPNKFLSWSFNEQEGTYVMVADTASPIPSNIDQRGRREGLFAGFYYLLQTTNCDMETIRKGPILIAECDGFDWRIRKNLQNAFRNLFQLPRELLSVYPRRPKTILYNTGMIINVMFSTVKKIVPRNLFGDRLETMGRRTDVDAPRLDTIYLVPNADIATQRLLWNLIQSLKRRIENEKSFSL